MAAVQNLSKELKEEIDQMRLETVRELRDMKNGLQESMTTMSQSL